MAIRTDADLTRAVLAEVQRTPDSRLRQLLTSAVEHLHAFVRDTQLTEAEFRQLCGLVARAGQLTTPSHNEVVLAAGSLGVSALVCLLNNGDGETETTANLMGPFWRAGSPPTPNGGSIVRSPTPGDPVFVTAWVQDEAGQPGRRRAGRHLAGLRRGLLREPGSVAGRHEPARHLHHRRAGPHPLSHRQAIRLPGAGQRAGRPVDPGAGAAQPAARAHPLPGPQAGLQGAVLAAVLQRRPAPGHRRAVRRHAGAHRPVRAARGQAAPAPDVQGRWYTLEHRFTLTPGDAALPPPPITAKADGERPPLVVLERKTPGASP
jgi:hydroxyquinol 1,2-dioxygenase